MYVLNLNSIIYHYSLCIQKTILNRDDISAFSINNLFYDTQVKVNYYLTIIIFAENIEFIICFKFNCYSII